LTITKAVIPAAGTSTGLYPITRAQPKEMLPLGRKPTVQFVVEELIAAGITEICIVISRLSSVIEQHFSLGGKSPLNGSFPSELLDDRARMYFVEQPEPDGLGDALLRARGFVGNEPFVVALGDAVITGVSSADALVTRMIRSFEATGADAVVAVRNVPRAAVSHYGIVTPVGEVANTPHFMIADVVEKPSIDNTTSTIALAGRYVLTSLIFDYLREMDGAGAETHFTDALQRMVHDRESVWAESIKPGEDRLDVDSFLEYSRAFIRFSLEDPEVGISIREYLQDLVMG